MYRRTISLLGLVLLLTGCLTPTISDGMAQTCPVWTRFSTATCDVRLWKDQIDSPQPVNLSDWEAIRITTVERDILIDEGVNIKVEDDLGESVDYVHSRLSPGSYVIRKNDNTKPASFKMVNPYGSNLTYFSAELVRPSRKK